MSLILEALRKSEAERQRGRAPGLFVEQSLARSRGRRSSIPWPWLLGALLGLALLSWGAWRWTHPETPVSDPSATLATTTEPVPVPGVAPAPEPLEPPDPEPVPGYNAGPGDPYSNPGADSPPGSIDVPGPAVAENPPPVRPRLMDTAVPRVANVEDPVEVDRSVRAQPSPIELPAPLDPPPQPLPTAAPEVPAAVEEALPSLAALPAADRTQLPPLKLSMHVYAAEPAQRFVIVDGKRLTEGASPAPGLVVEEIRRDGVVLSINGQRLLLSRP